MQPSPSIRQAAQTVLLISVLAFSACASTPHSESTGEYLDDSMLTTRVKAAVFNDPLLKSSEINVETFKGRVQLSGFVSSTAEMQRALAVAKDVKGVTTVNSDMKLK